MQRSLQRHQQIRELLPWYVTGTLDEGETDLVSAHLAQCADCSMAVKKEIALSRRVREQPASVNEVAAMEASAFAALQASLPHRTAQSGPRSAWRLRAVTAAAVLLVAGTSFIVGRASLDDTYQVMTSSPGQPGTVIQLIFQPRTSEQDVRQLLQDAGGVLLGTPSERGVYRIGLPDQADGRAYAARLQNHPAVRWAEVELP